jgi:hypothetical protein
MSVNGNAEPDGNPRVIPEIKRGMLPGRLRKAEIVPLMAQIGACLDFARRYLGWTLDELAAHLPAPKKGEARDPRQVQRWIDGTERCQMDVVFGVEALRAPFVVALAKMAPRAVIRTVIEIPEEKTA